MAVSMQVAYPINDDTSFDLDYYVKNLLGHFSFFMSRFFISFK
mgnify:CR=1 FL=1